MIGRCEPSLLWSSPRGASEQWMLVEPPLVNSVRCSSPAESPTHHPFGERNGKSSVD